MADTESIIESILFFIGLMIALVIPVPIKEEYRLFAITAIIFIFLVIILSRYNSRLEKQSSDTEDLNKRFKTLEDLSEVRLNIKELQREVFK